MASLVTYLKNVRIELTHVVWPSQRQALGHVAIIIIISIFTALFIAALDYVFTNGIREVLL